MPSVTLGPGNDLLKAYWKWASTVRYLKLLSSFIPRSLGNWISDQEEPFLQAYSILTLASSKQIGWIWQFLKERCGKLNNNYSIILIFTIFIKPDLIKVKVIYILPYLTRRLVRFWATFKLYMMGNILRCLAYLDFLDVHGSNIHPVFNQEWGTEIVVFLYITSWHT